MRKDCVSAPNHAMLVSINKVKVAKSRTLVSRHAVDSRVYYSTTIVGLNYQLEGASNDVY